MLIGDDQQANDRPVENTSVRHGLDLLGSRFRVETIFKGAAGLETYLAFDTELNRKVIIKSACLFVRTVRRRAGGKLFEFKVQGSKSKNLES